MRWTTGAAVLAAASAAALVSGLVALTPLHFVPLFPLFWVLPFLAVRAMGVASSRSRHLPSGRRNGDDGKVRELLEALERRGWITATRAALETSLGVGEAAERLSGLAEKGHLRATAYGGSLAYSLWDANRRQVPEPHASPGEIEDGPS
jgi:hypothetical protein